MLSLFDFLQCSVLVERFVRLWQRLWWQSCSMLFQNVIAAVGMGIPNTSVLCRNKSLRDLFFFVFFGCYCSKGT